MTKYILIILGSILIVSCNYSNCKNDADIYVSDLLINHTSNRNIDYCYLLKGTIEEKKEIYSEFLRLEIYDGAGYDHGITLSELVEYLGEDTFIEITSSLNFAERNLIKSYLESGIESDNKRNGNSFKSLFPNVNREFSKE
ncbi:MAG: hypothetical protein ACI9P5_004642 [Saprospiraceae bacterium]|jgi:hypothetical protein